MALSSPPWEDSGDLHNIKSALSGAGESSPSTGSSGYNPELISNDLGCFCKKLKAQCHRILERREPYYEVNGQRLGCMGLWVKDRVCVLLSSEGSC